MVTIAKGESNFPPGYLTFKHCGLPPQAFHFPGGIALVHRFAHRYRFAQEFQSAKFATFRETTAAGYSALAKFLFTYAAFEALRRALGIPEDLSTFDIQKYPCTEWDASLRAIPTHGRLFHFLTKHLKPGLRDQCRQFLWRRPYSVLLLAQSVRNGFAHGHLSGTS
jgi:hypothetical protein